jgi:hypothetical protein
VGWTVMDVCCLYGPSQPGQGIKCVAEAKHVASSSRPEPAPYQALFPDSLSRSHGRPCQGTVLVLAVAPDLERNQSPGVPLRKSSSSKTA